MASLFLKGRTLERRMGKLWFAYLLSVFSLLTGLVYLLLEAGLPKLMDNRQYAMLLEAGLPKLMHDGECGVGFSGVLFGLSVVNNPWGVTDVLGELFFIHFLIPRSRPHACRER
ncbi:rhomboid-related protein 4-like [Engraulis encrasicolus]|uniref:rhomboid-related protein 4-like n=1 Tax=Engraulis encrasicolus TaxID=184585 RepID=UPI002FCF49D9